MKKISTTMLLEANFDIDQIGETLEWRFSRRDGNGNPIVGPDAGSIYFTVGEKFLVQVKGGSRAPFTGFKVLDCCLISRPQILECGPTVKTVYAPPSPFAPEVPGTIRGASIQLAAEKFKVRATPQESGYFQITQDWTDHLTVADVPARWELSFIITVSITRADGSVELRAFDFDPETSVGTGVVPDEFCLDEVALCPETSVGTGVVPDAMNV